jgi:hypothetical protein
LIGGTENGNRRKKKQTFSTEQHQRQPQFTECRVQLYATDAICFQAEVFQNGDVRLQLMREDIPLTPLGEGAFMINTDKIHGRPEIRRFTEHMQAFSTTLMIWAGVQV